MQIETFETRRTPEGVIDIQYYARRAHAARRTAKSSGMRKVGHGLKRAVIAVVAFIAFWNIPSMGSVSSKEWPYR